MDMDTRDEVVLLFGMVPNIMIHPFGWESE